MYKNICLIGLPYSGKSYLGYRLSLTKKKNIIEKDKLLEDKFNCSIQEIINICGVNNFLKSENIVGSKIQCQNKIISTGGSMVYNMEAMNHIKYNLSSKVIHLEISYDEFLNRIDNYDERGIINKFGLILNELYLERIRLCNVYSNVTINCDDLDIGFKRLLNYKLYD